MTKFTRLHALADDETDQDKYEIHVDIRAQVL